VTRKMCSHINLQTHTSALDNLVTLTFWPQRQCMLSTCYGVYVCRRVSSHFF